MTHKQQRLGLLALSMIVLTGAITMVLTAFSDNLVSFYSPSDLKTQATSPDRWVRIGGLVEDRSVQRGAGGRIAFRITDGQTDIAVVYEGTLPDFREGQGLVAEGMLTTDGVFEASTILAKHVERYIPREVVVGGYGVYVWPAYGEALKSGHW
jgi:cytochrome c-type biogenesis protein CcmE